jgi:hypothetical protein
LKLAQANSSQDPISKKPFTKKTGGVAQGVGPEFKSQYCKQKKSNKKHKDFQMTTVSTCISLVIKKLKSKPGIIPFILVY